MNCYKFPAIGFSLIVMLCVAGNARAQLDIEVLTFEPTEADLVTDTYGAVQSNVGLDGVVGGVGITEGSNALIMSDVPASPSAAFVTYQFSSASVGEEGNNYAGFDAAEAAMDAGLDVYLSFDFGFDVSGVTNNAFFQPGVAVNSDAGFSEKRFGALLEGNIGPAATSFPTLDAGAAGQGVVMQILDPMNAPGGDPRGVVRMIIPISNDGTKALNIGDGGDGTNNFFQFQLHKQGGWTGTIDVSLDNVGFVVIPEPASVALAGLGLVTALIGRRRTTGANA